MQHINCSVAILAGGKSRRFGKDKGLVDFNNKPLVQHVIDIANKISNDVFIISNNIDYQRFELPIYNDHFKSCGPLGGLHAALKNGRFEHCFLLACDMPFLNEWLLYGLYEMKQHQAVVPLHKNRPEPLCALYHSSALSVVETNLQSGQLKMTDTIEQLDHHWYHVEENCEFYDPKLFVNINTQQEWEKHQ